MTLFIPTDKYESASYAPDIPAGDGSTRGLGVFALARDWICHAVTTVMAH